MVAVPQEAALRLYKGAGFRVFGAEPTSLKIGERFVDEYQMTLEFDSSQLGDTQAVREGNEMQL